MKKLLAVFLFAIAGIAFLQFDPLSDKPKVEPIEVVEVDFSKDTSDQILAVAFDESVPVIEPEKTTNKIQVKTVSVKANRSEPAVSISQIEYAFKMKKSNIQVRAYGSVLKLLSDDNNGQHQRFLLKLSNEQVLLIAHNIQFAPKIASLEQGDRIDFYGEYMWNDDGGAVHWTHKDPKNKHKHGWLKHQGNIYQ